MLRNLTKRTIISENLNKKPSFFDNLFGMIAGNNPNGLVLETTFGIHSLFMSKNIDILVLDENKKVVLARKDLKPFRLFFWNPKFNTIIELPKGSIDKSKTEIGDELDF